MHKVTGLLILLFSTACTAQAPHSILSNEKVHQFCEEKPIWNAFGIDITTCKEATQHCARKPEFTDIDKKQLSEAFYLCVFNQLGIEI